MTPAAMSADLSASSSGPRSLSATLRPPLAVLVFYGGLGLVYSDIVNPYIGIATVSIGLLVGLLREPVEYALGALACSFLLALTDRAEEYFATLRWVMLAVGSSILYLRCVLRAMPGRRARWNSFEYLLLMFVIISAGTQLFSLAPTLTAFKLGAMALMLLSTGRTAAFLSDLYGAAGPRRLVLGLIAYPLPLVVLSALSFVRQPRLGPEGLFAGLFSHPNACGALLALMLPWTAACVFRAAKGPLGRLMGVLALGALAYFLLLTVSRSALLGALAAGVAFCLIHLNRRIGAVLLVSGVLVSARLLADPELLPRFTQRYLYKHSRGQEDLLQSRLPVWKRARADFEKRPWLGLGFGLTSERESEWALDVFSTGAVETGSSFWSVLVQVGIIGATPLFLALILLVVNAGRFAWKVKDPWFTAVYGSILALLAHSAFEGWLTAPGNFSVPYLWIQCFVLNATMCRFRPGPPGRLGEFTHARPSLGERHWI